MKLHAHECCECGGAMSYSVEPDVLPDAMCKDCAITHVEVARFMGVLVVDQHEQVIDSTTIYLDSRSPSEDWMSNGRGQLLKWCRARNVDWCAIERRASKCQT